MEGPRHPNWFAAKAKPNAARIAARNLEAQGFHIFMPMERYTQRRGGRFVEALRPYFAGYFFVGADASSSPWRAIRSTHGVAQLVSFGGTPQQVDARLIQEIQSSCVEGVVTSPSVSYKVGEAVRVAQGAFVGFIGRFEGLAPNERAWLLLDIMGQATRVKMPLDGVRGASSL